MSKIINENSSFDTDIPVPESGDRNYAPIVEEAFKKLANRTVWLKQNQMVGPQGPTGANGADGATGLTGATGVSGFSSLNGLTNPGNHININAGSNIQITDDGVDSIVISATVAASADTYYINENPTTSTIGGIQSGTTFPASSPKTVQQVLDMLLYPYQSPGFTSFSISNLGASSASGNTVEVGDTIASNRTFTWSTSNSGNVLANSISIIDQTNGNTVLASSLANDGNQVVTNGSITKTSSTSHTFQIRGTNTNSGTFTGSYTINWRHRRWWGVSASSTMTSAGLLTLGNNEFSTSRSKSMVLDGDAKYIYIAYPESWGAASFTVNGLLNTAWTLSVINHTNASGHVESYNVYRSNTVQNGSGISINVS
jgi:hypothetical protein